MTTKQVLGLRETLQSVELALLDNGWTEIMVATDFGVFQWSKATYPHGVVVHHEDGSETKYTGAEWEKIARGQSIENKP